MLGLPTPYVIGGLLLVGFLGGYKVKDWQCDAAYSKALEKAQKKQAEMQETINEKAAAFEAERDKAHVVDARRSQTIREIYRTLPAPRVDCAAPASLSGVLQSSVRDANAAASGQSGSSVRGAADASGDPDRP